MGVLRLLVVFVLAVAAGCATVPSPRGLAMAGTDEAGAAAALGGYLLARGWMVRLEADALVQASRQGEQLRLAPVLDADGVDRIVAARSWMRTAPATDEDIEQLAGELNRSLNVGLFYATPEGLDFESSLFFIDQLDPELLEAFIAFTADVELAVRRVQGERELLAPVEALPASR